MSAQFEQRKHDHLFHALDGSNQAEVRNDLQSIQLIHESLPEINLSEVSIESEWLDQPIQTPFYVAGMTAGHQQAQSVNALLAKFCESRGWLFGVGSQRREFEDSNYQDQVLLDIRARHPHLKMISNLGLSQLISAHQNKSFKFIFNFIERISAQSIAIHLNPLQEAIQVEGSPDFKGGINALKEFIHECHVPVVIKETGSGMSRETVAKLSKLQPFAIDVSGCGGTHWGRIEGKRAPTNHYASRLGETFQDWGVSTVESVAEAVQVFANHQAADFKQPEIWASGGVKTGLDAAKLIALGASRVGFAHQALKAAVQGEIALASWMQVIEQELKVALFCTGSEKLSDLNILKLKGASHVETI